ncbi:MAG TPA: methylated-DNA--[protein]-cysteine S-methyltransferase [Burkholderiales bacterium]|nr:methylated-DNA--[protein]-cysteine S-methyltransferase [Burkholderiales bacterium]
MELFLNRIESPLGEMLLVTDGQGMVRALDFTNHQVRLQRELRERFSGIELREAIETETVKMISGNLDRYFKGDLTALDDIAVAADGSDFQRQVWAALRKILAGKTTTYGELARSLGHTDPRMAKDIGAAVGANPIAVVVPCHRVIGRDGTLKGYAWGLQRKHRLLMHEKAEVSQGGTAALFSL